MCGINGYLNIENRELIKKMNTAIAHRGPNDSGVYSDKGVVLGNRRLSIIDIKSGHQPVHNEDSTIWITFNGEIYNFKELKFELEKSGHKFYTNTDTEAIVHLYEKYGLDFVKRLRGMFAFAVWDSAKKRLILCRDRLGKKPLYYWIKGGKLVFSSEIKAVLEHHEIKRVLNENGFYQYLTFKYVPGPQTMFKEIYKLLPGHIAIFEKGKFTIKKYWDIDLGEQAGDEEYYIKKFYNLLKESVDIRLMSEVPLGIYLSGGIDSSSIVGILRKELKKDVDTFTVGFDNGNFDESKYAKYVAETFGTNHKELTAKKESVKLLPEIIWHMDEPVGDAAIVPTYLISKLTKKYVTVVLTGDGGDELTAGYGYYKKLAKIQSLSKFRSIMQIPGIKGFSKIKVAAKYMDVIDKPGLLYVKNFEVFNRTERDSIVGWKSTNLDDITKVPNFWLEKKGGGVLNKIIYLDTKMKLADDFLMKVDKMCMASSIEPRCPFLDQNLVEFSFGIPLSIKLKEQKYILKKAVKYILPREILNRKKHGFNVPQSDWIKQLDLEKLFNEKVYNQKLIRKIIKDKKATNQKLWSLLVFEIWRKIYIDSEKVSMPKNLDKLLG